MEKRKLGNTGIEMTTLGFGCASVWGKSLITDQQATELFEQAYSLGIRYFDTGYSYGLAEGRIGKILKESSLVRREELVISTKFGTKVEHGRYFHDFTPQWVFPSVESSLRTMGLQYVDLVMVHGPQIADLTPQYLKEIHRLKEEGLAKAVGVNTFDTDVLEYIRDTQCVDFVMPDYNIMRQDREALLSQLHEKGIGVIAGAPLAESLYTNRVFKIRKPKDLWYLARALANHRGKIIQGQKYRFVNDVPGMTGAQVVLRYVLDNPNVTSAVFGCTTPSHLSDNAKAADITLPPDVTARIKNAEK